MTKTPTLDTPDAVFWSPDIVFWSIKTIREARKLTQQDLADAAGIDRKTINRIEKGHHYPTLPILFAIAFELDVPPTILLDEDAVWTMFATEVALTEKTASK